MGPWLGMESTLPISWHRAAALTSGTSTGSPASFAHWAVSVLRAPEDAARHLPPDPARCAILGEPQAALGDYVPNNPPAVLQYLDYHRAYKTAYELEQLWQANRIAVRAHRAAERAFRAGASEFGIHLAYCQAAGQDANDLPYGNIVALNQHAAVLHYTARDRLPPRPARSLLIDAGASHAGYAADVTRTHAAEDGASTPMLMKMSGHTSVRSLAKYARPSAEALARWRAQTDPAARGHR